MHIPPRFAELIDSLNSPVVAYYSGSTAEGTGHAHSDVDLYVISDDVVDTLPPDGLNTSTTFKGGPISIFIGHFEGQRWDLERWSSCAVTFILNKLESDSATGRKSLSHGDAEFLCRAVNGRPFLGKSAHELLRERILNAGLRRVLMRRFAYSAEVRLEDAAGLARSGSDREAALQIRDAFGFVVDMELARNHDFSLSTKRRLLRLERLSSSDFTAEEYWNAERMDFEGDIGEWCRRTTLRLRQVLSHVD